MLKVIAILAAVLTLLLVAAVSYCVLQFLARGILIEGAAIVIGFIAAIAVKNAIMRGARSSE